MAEINGTVTPVMTVNGAVGVGGKQSNEGGSGISQSQLDATVQRVVSAAINAESERVNREIATLKEQARVQILPRVCFVDDDGAVEAKTVLFPWLQAQNVPYTFAIATGDTASGDPRFASWDDLRAMQADSRVSWSCHAVGDDVMTDYTAEEMGARYAQWRRDMAAHGLRSDATTVMYNHGSYVQDTIDRAVSKYFRYGFTVVKGINTAPLDAFHMKRVGLFPTDGSYTIAQAKTLVDQLVALQTGVVIFFTHAYYETFNLSGLTELVNYIRAKGVEIAPLEETLRLYEAAVSCECGDWVEAAGDPEYSKSLAQATSATSGQKVNNSSAQNCVMTVPVAGGKRIKASGTAYSNNGMVSWLDSEGRVIGCIWQAPDKSGDNARFSLELPVPYGAERVMVSGNSSRQLPRVEVLSTGSGGVSRQEFEDYKSQQFESIADAKEDSLPKSPANWEPWTVEEQAAARERIAIRTMTQEAYDLLPIDQRAGIIIITEEESV